MLLAVVALRRAFQVQAAVPLRRVSQVQAVAPLCRASQVQAAVPLRRVSQVQAVVFLRKYMAKSMAVVRLPRYVAFVVVKVLDTRLTPQTFLS
jgi:hypothetical protein